MPRIVNVYMLYNFILNLMLKYITICDSILSDAVLKGEKIPEGVEIQADKRLILEFVRVCIS